MPDASALIERGTRTEADGQPLTADGLTPRTSYFIAAVAAMEDLCSEVASAPFTTDISPEIILEPAAEATYLTAAFNVTVANADRAAWMLLPAGEDPDAARVLEQGEEIAADGTAHAIRLPEPEPGVEYTVAVAAANERMQKVETCVMTTQPEPEYDYSGVCTFGAGTYYGDMDNDQGTGEFFLTLSDAEVTPEGYAASEGYILQLDLYSLLAADKMNASPQEGIYRFVTPQPSQTPGEFTDACTQWSIGGVNSIVRELDEQGIIVASSYLHDATLEYRKREDGSCRIVAYATLGGGLRLRMRWDGPVEFANRIPGVLQDLDATDYEVIEANFYGKKNTTGSEEFVIRFVDDATHPTQSMVLDFYAPPGADPSSPRIPAGTYHVANWLDTDPYTFCIGDVAFGSIFMGSFVEEMVDGLPLQGIVTDGSFTVAEANADAYAFTFDLTIADPDRTLTRTVTGSCNCTFVIENKYPIPPGDLAIGADRVHRAVYDPTPSSSGASNYRVELLDCPFAEATEGSFKPASGGSGNRVILDFWAAAAADPSNPELPEGTYYLDFSLMPGTCHGQYTLVEHFDPNGNLLPLTFWNAKITVTRKESNYSISFDGEDILNERITCTYEGPIDFVSGTVRNVSERTTNAGSPFSTGDPRSRTTCDVRDGERPFIPLRTLNHAAIGFRPRLLPAVR